MTVFKTFFAYSVTTVSAMLSFGVGCCTKMVIQMIELRILINQDRCDIHYVFHYHLPWCVCLARKGVSWKNEVAKPKRSISLWSHWLLVRFTLLGADYLVGVQPKFMVSKTSNDMAYDRSQLFRCIQCLYLFVISICILFWNRSSIFSPFQYHCHYNYFALFVTHLMDPLSC